MSTLLFALLKWWAFSGLEKFRLFRWKLEMRLASPSSSTGNLGPFTVVKSRSTQSAAVTFEVPEKMILQGKFFKFYYYFWPFCTWHLLSSDSAQDAVKSTITTVMSYFVICILGNIKKDFYNLCVMQVKWVGARWLREGLWVPCEFLHLLHACAAYINLCVCVREGERGEVSQRKVCVMSSPGRLCCQVAVKFKLLSGGSG